jgi:hypothetical protein
MTIDEVRAHAREWMSKQDASKNLPMRDTTQDTFEVAHRSDRKKVADKIRVRRMTRDEVMQLHYGQHPEVILNDGRLGEVKINGAIKTWKREPDRAEIPVKYGMYECARFSLDEALQRFVVRVE